MGHSSPRKSSLPGGGSASPVAPGTPNTARQQHRSLSPARKPWVSAEWRNRVPEDLDTKPSSSPATPRTAHAQHQAALIAEKRRQVAADFSGAHETIERMLARCKLVQDTLHTSPPRHSPQHTCSHNSSSRSAQPSTPRPSTPTGASSGPSMHLTMRSQLLFEAPPTAAAQSRHNSSSGSSAGAAAKVQEARAGDVKQQQDRQHTAWRGAVDLNPGFQFRPGTPERAAAVLRHAASPAVTAAAAERNVGAAAVVPGTCCLTQREHLQAGIQELNGAFYKGIRQQQWHQHQEQLGQQADVIPQSWFGI